MPGKSLNEFSLETSVPGGVRNIISTGYSQWGTSRFASSSPLAARFSKSSMMIDVLTKFLFSRVMTFRSESRPALKSVPLGQQLWSSNAPQETTAKIGRSRLRASVST